MESHRSVVGSYGYVEENGNKEYLQLDENGRFRYEFGWYQGQEMATEAYTGTWAYDWSQPKFGKVMCQATQAKYAIPGKLEKIASERLLQFHVQQGDDIVLVSRFHNKAGLQLPRTTTYQTGIYQFGTECVRGP